MLYLILLLLIVEHILKSKLLQSVIVRSDYTQTIMLPDHIIRFQYQHYMFLFLSDILLMQHGLTVAMEDPDALTCIFFLSMFYDNNW